MLFLRCFDIVFYMFRCISQTLKQKKKGSWLKLAKEMFGYIWQFQLRNSLKYPKFKQSTTKKFPKTTSYAEVKKILLTWKNLNTLLQIPAT